MDDNQKIIYVKEDFTWHFVSMYLDGLMISTVNKDEEFMRLYRQLCDYVSSKIFMPCEGELVELSVVVGRKLK